MLRISISLLLILLALVAPIVAPGSGIEDAIEVACLVVLHRGEFEDGKCYWI